MQRSLIQRVLSPIAEVRRGEATSALLMTLLIFLLLAAYYLMKTAREIMILTEGGAAVKSYSSAGQAVLLLFVVPAYGAFASRVSAVKLVTVVTLIFTAMLAGFALAVSAGIHVGIVYFLWLGIFNLMVVAQFWAFAADVYTEEQGKRLFPLIGVGGSLGAWIGSLRAGAIVESSGPMRLILVSVVILLICTALVPVIFHQSKRAERSAAAKHEDAPIGHGDGFAMIRADRYLMLIAAFTLLLNVVNTNGEYLFGRFIVEQSQNLSVGPGEDAAAARERFVGQTYSQFYSTVNLVGFLLQMFVVSRLIKWLGVDRSLMVHPLIALSGYMLMLRAPSLQTMSVVKVADNSVNYSLSNTTRQALWLPTSREAKYKAKQAIDSFVVRAGDVVSAAIVFVGERLTFAVSAFAAVNVVLAAVWFLVVVMLTSTQARRAAPSPAA